MRIYPVHGTLRRGACRKPFHTIWCSTVKTALWILGVLLVLDLLFVSYFHVFRAGYYFPDRYEEALGADLFALLFGLPVLGAFVTLLITHLYRRKQPQENTTSADGH